MREIKRISIRSQNPVSFGKALLLNFLRFYRLPQKVNAAACPTAILLLRNSTAKGAKRHEKGKYTTCKHRENTQI
jgi:hypothetical protein